MGIIRGAFALKDHQTIAAAEKQAGVVEDGQIFCAAAKKIYRTHGEHWPFGLAELPGDDAGLAVTGPDLVVPDQGLIEAELRDDRLIGVGVGRGLSGIDIKNAGACSDEQFTFAALNAA